MSSESVLKIPGIVSTSVGFQTPPGLGTTTVPISTSLWQLDYPPMTTSNRHFYILNGLFFAINNSDSNASLPLVLSADIVVWPESLLTNDRECYAEIRLDRRIVRATQAVKPDKALTWNEKFVLYVVHLSPIC
jgi:hypothetical protein